MDPDKPYRTRLISDVRERVSDLGSVDAILVSGDIAFQGAPEEYEAAWTWLRELASSCGCVEGRVFVVPGNHDVDRTVVTGRASVRNVQQMIASAEPDRRESELLHQLQDAEAGRALFEPIAAYNDFAKRFHCQVYAPERLFWCQDLPLDDQTVLRLYGLTSTLLSGANGRDDTRTSLYLSPLQTVLDPVDGIINLVICHHPPDWFKDQDDVEDAVRSRAAIHLFGHKHRQRFYKDDGCARFSAGAVNPDRNEPGWQPGYNLISLSVGEENGARHLEIEAHLLAWQTMPEMFRPIAVSQTETVFRHRVPIRGEIAAAPRSLGAPAAVRLVSDPEAMTATDTLEEPTEVEAAMGDERIRNLIFRFWNLTMSQRRDISLSLGLIDESEMELPEPERYGRALIRAREQGLLDRVAEEVERLERH